MVCVPSERLRHDLLELRLHVVDALARRQARPVADAVDMRVDREGLLAEGGVEDHVGGLAADARQCLKLLASPWNVAAMMIDQRLAERDDVPGLGVEQADRLDRIAQPFLTEFNHLPRSHDVGEQRPARDVDARVGRLGGEHNRNQQLIRAGRFKFGSGRGVGFGETPEELENLAALHASITSRIA
jgi:hypothetical protein